MQKLFYILVLIVFVGCKKYERVNPLDPYYEEPSKAELIIESIEVIETTQDISYRYFRLNPTIKNIGNKATEGGVSGTLSTNDSNIVLCENYEYFTSCLHCPLNPNEIGNSQMSFTLKIDKSLQIPYNASFNLSLKDDISGDTWNLTFNTTLQ